MSNNVPGLILAGGLARRMGGGDKSLLLLRDKEILSHVIERLAPQVGQILLNANGDVSRFSRFGLPVLPDSLPDYPGPLAGVLAGLDWAADQGHDHIVTVAADTPFFPLDLVKALTDAATHQAKPIALAATRDPDKGLLRQPTFGVWPTALRQDLRRSVQDGLRKIVAWTDRHGTALAEFPAIPFDPFFNINTPADLQQAAKMLEARES